jgi:Flp pilus assembly pilin Flp
METFMTTIMVRERRANALHAVLPFCLSAFGAFARRTFTSDPRMRRVLVAVDRLARTEEGQDLLEYGMIVVLIAVGAVVAVTSVGSMINAVLWQAIAASNY